MNFIASGTAPHAKMTFTHDDGNTVEVEMRYNSGGVPEVALTKKILLSAYEDIFGNIAVPSADRTDKSIHDVYMAGSIGRKDYTINNNEGLAIVEKLEASWPGFIPNYRVRPYCLVSEFTPLRVPYINPSISYYMMGEQPSDALIATYSLPYETYKNWYGLKFDTITTEVLIKVVISKEEMLRAHPDICNTIEASIPVYGNHFFGLIYNSDGELDPNIDVYFNTDYNIVQEWVDSMELTMPYTDLTLSPKRIFWGVVYNTTNNNFTHIKAYIVNYIED